MGGGDGLVLGVEKVEGGTGQEDVWKWGEASFSVKAAYHWLGKEDSEVVEWPESE